MVCCGAQSGRPEFDDWDDAELDDTIVRDFHFGGGFVPKEKVDDQAAADAVPERPKSKKEVKHVQ